MALANRILSALLALALLLGGLLATAEIVLTQLGRPPWLVPHDQWSSWLGAQTFDGTVVRVALVLLVVLGLLLLVPGLRRGKPGTLALRPSEGGAGHVRMTASRRGVEKSLASAARRTSGITSATATAGRRSVRVKARTSTRSAGDLQTQVTAAVTGRLEELGLSGTLRPRVTISKKEAR